MSEEKQPVPEKKLSQARFFLDLLQKSKWGKMNEEYKEKQAATFLTNALLNTCYSVVEHTDCKFKRLYNGANRNEVDAKVKKFRDDHKDLYEEGKGIRHRSVHFAEIETNEKSLGAWGSFRFGAMRFGEGGKELYFDDLSFNDGSRGPLVQKFKVHIEELEELIEDCKNIT